MRVSGAMRHAAVAGTFYEGSRDGLRHQIEACFVHAFGPGSLPTGTRGQGRPIIGLVSPHAGYIYSGPVAAHGFFELSSQPKPSTVVILGPNHYGAGETVSISGEDKWETPLGEVSIDIEAASAIVSATGHAKFDNLAHRWEHSIEVQLPFLQYIWGSHDLRIVPISMLLQTSRVSMELGEAIGTALQGKGALIIASSDFTHRELASTARRKDHLVIDSILTLDPARIEQAVFENRVSMCGPGPVMAMIAASKALGATGARLLHYGSSGDITGDPEVVGYASICVTAQ